MIKKIIFFIAFLLLALVYSYHYAFGQRADNETLIKNIMMYPMPHILARCQKDYNYTDEDMIILEKELKRYLILSLFEGKADLGTGMYSKDVDNLWHAFILFTNEYAAFCNTYFNRFIHHIPEIDTQPTPEKLREARQDFQVFVKKYQEVFKEEIHPIWFLDMCEE